MGNVSRLKKEVSLLPEPEDETGSHVLLGYALVAIFQFMFGLFVGWVIWG